MVSQLKCQTHFQNQINIICLENKCEIPFLCNLCVNQHNQLHTLISISEIKEKGIYSSFKKIFKFKTEENFKGKLIEIHQNIEGKLSDYFMSFQKIYNNIEIEKQNNSLSINSKLVSLENILLHDYSINYEDSINILNEILYLTIEDVNVPSLIKKKESILFNLIENMVKTTDLLFQNEMTENYFDWIQMQLETIGTNNFSKIVDKENFLDFLTNKWNSQFSELNEHFLDFLSNSKDDLKFLVNEIKMKDFKISEIKRSSEKNNDNDNDITNSLQNRVKEKLNEKYNNLISKDNIHTPHKLDNFYSNFDTANISPKHLEKDLMYQFPKKEENNTPVHKITNAPIPKGPIIYYQSNSLSGSKEFNNNNNNNNNNIIYQHAVHPEPRKIFYTKKY